MKIYGIEKLTLVDFDAHCSCILFTGACNFCCPFCQNSALVIDQLPDPIDENEIEEYLKARTNVLYGVVISGGEPTINKGLPDYIRHIKSAYGYKIKLDTNGSNPEMLKQLVEEGLVDYVAMDIKNSLDDYDLAIGIENYDTTKVKESIDYLKEGHVDYEFRTTLVYELHSKKNIEEIAELLKGAKRYFLQHFEDRGGNICDSLTAIPKEQAEEFVDILKKNIENVSLRGY